MSALLELAARCEAATGADRELDMDIAEAIMGPVRDGYWSERKARFASGEYPLDAPKFFTSPLDAAMMLVPAKYGQYEIYSPDHNTLGWTVHLACDGNLHLESQSGFATSYALALCAAALRAQAANA